MNRPAPTRWHQPLGRLPETLPHPRRLEIIPDRQQPRQDALTVGLDNRLGPIERKREDRPGDVTAHPRQGTHRRRIFGDHAIILCHDHPRGRMELPRPPVIAQPFPRLQDLDSSAAASDPTSGNRPRNRSKYGITAVTVVWTSIISETKMR